MPTAWILPRLRFTGRLPTEIPKTTLPSGESVERAFDRIRQAGYTHVLAIHLSGGLSGTCNLVRLISEQTEGLEIAVFDSLSGSLGIGVTILAGCALDRAGLDMGRAAARDSAAAAGHTCVFLRGHAGISAKGRAYW